MIRAFFVFLILVFLTGCSRKTVEEPQLGARISMDSSIYVNVKDYGATGRADTDDTQAFNSAMRAADLLHKAVFVPVGRYKVNLSIAADNIKLVGEKQPDEMLAGGSVIAGKINCNKKKNITIANLAIDSQGQLGDNDVAALFSGDGSDSIILNQTFRDLTLIGDGYTSYKHGILCQVGSGITIRNILVVNFYHGIAIRSSNISVDTVRSVNCGFTSVIIKSAEGANKRTENVYVDHINISGNPHDPYSRGGMVLIQSYAPESITRNIHVQHVDSKYGSAACVAVDQHEGIVDQVLVENCFSMGQGNAATQACYDVAGGSNIVFRNCTAINSRGWGFRATGNVRGVRVEDSYEHKSRQGSWRGSFAYLQLNGKEIIR